MTGKQRLLLIGGGHAHLFVLEALRRRRTERVGKLEVTLLSRDLQLMYSGMLPGLMSRITAPVSARSSWPRKPGWHRCAPQSGASTWSAIPP